MSRRLLASVDRPRSPICGSPESEVEGVLPLLTHTVDIGSFAVKIRRHLRLRLATAASSQVNCCYMHLIVQEQFLENQIVTAERIEMSLEYWTRLLA